MSAISEEIIEVGFKTISDEYLCVEYTHDKNNCKISAFRFPEYVDRILLVA